MYGTTWQLPGVSLCLRAAGDHLARNSASLSLLESVVEGRGGTMIPVLKLGVLRNIETA